MVASLIIEATCDDVRTAEIAIFAMFKYKEDFDAICVRKENANPRALSMNMLVNEFIHTTGARSWCNKNTSCMKSMSNAINTSSTAMATSSIS